MGEWESETNFNRQMEPVIHIPEHLQTYVSRVKEILNSGEKNATQRAILEYVAYNDSRLARSNGD